MGVIYTNFSVFSVNSVRNWWLCYALGLLQRLFTPWDLLIFKELEKIYSNVSEEKIREKFTPFTLLTFSPYPGRHKICGGSVSAISVSSVKNSGSEV